MKFKSEVEIARPMHELIVLIQNPENTLKWLDGLRSVKHISGEERQAGAISKVVFDSPAGRLHITETVVSNELPDEYIIRYEGLDRKSGPWLLAAQRLMQQQRRSSAPWV